MSRTPSPGEQDDELGMEELEHAVSRLKLQLKDALEQSMIGHSETHTLLKAIAKVQSEEVVPNLRGMRRSMRVIARSAKRLGNGGMKRIILWLAGALVVANLGSKGLEILAGFIGHATP